MNYRWKGKFALVLTNDKTRPTRRRGPRLILGVFLLGVLGLSLMLFVPALMSGWRTNDIPLLSRAECTVETAGGKIGLNRDEAKLATTAVALSARGLEAPDTSGIDEVVLQRLADGPDNDAGPGLTCRGSAATNLQEEQLTATGLTPRAQRLREAMADVFGDQSLGGFAPGGVGEEASADSTHSDGRAIDIFFRPVTEENRREGWVLAHWLVAHAEDLDIQYVIFDDRFWSVHSSRGLWHHYDAPAPGNEILRHLDHVHVDVLGGSTD